MVAAADDRGSRRKSTEVVLTILSRLSWYVARPLEGAKRSPSSSFQHTVVPSTRPWHSILPSTTDYGSITSVSQTLWSQKALRIRSSPHAMDCKRGTYSCLHHSGCLDRRSRQGAHSSAVKWHHQPFPRNGTRTGHKRTAETATSKTDSFPIGWLTGVDRVSPLYHIPSRITIESMKQVPVDE